MGITFPDNAKRVDRVVELSTDAQNYLQESTASYEEFQSLLKHVNGQLKTVYGNAGLKLPEITSLDILKEADVDVQGADIVTEVSMIVLDIAGIAAEFKYFAPAMTRVLVQSGLMSEKVATKVLMRFGKGAVYTVSDLVGLLVSGVVSGAAIAGIDIGISAIEGALLRSQLRDSIDQLFPMRTALDVSRLKTAKLCDSLRSMKTTLDVLEFTPEIKVTDDLIRKLLQKDAAPALAEAKEITDASVDTALNDFDKKRHSYTKDDPSRGA